MSSYGVGQGLNEGVKTAGHYIMQGLLMKQRQDMAEKSLIADLSWKNGWAGMGPGYDDEPQDGEVQAPATSPSAPYSAPLVQPGSMGLPSTRFRTGSPVQPMSAAPTRAPGAVGLLPPSMGVMGQPPRMRRRY